MNKKYLKDFHEKSTAFLEINKLRERERIIRNTSTPNRCWIPTSGIIDLLKRFSGQYYLHTIIGYLKFGFFFI